MRRRESEGRGQRRENQKSNENRGKEAPHNYISPLSLAFPYVLSS